MKEETLIERAWEKVDTLVQLLDNVVDDRLFIVTDLAHQLKDELETLKEEE